MGNKFLKIENKEALESLLSDSKSKPVVVFKHSNLCPISAFAYREMEKFEGEVNLLVIQKARDVSSELAELTGVKHESPQVIVLRDGKAVWNTSHFGVRATALAQALASLI